MRMKRAFVCRELQVVWLALACALPSMACGGKAKAAVITVPVEPAPAVSPVISSEILAREPVANTADIKHILISWKDLEAETGGRLDERAKKRTQKDAEAVVTELLDKLKNGSDFDSLMKEWSEDEGSAASGKVFTVEPSAQLVLAFRQLGLRLNVGEVGVCESQFGFHIMKRYR